MRLIGKKSLEKVKRKNRGNTPLCRAIDKLTSDIEAGDWQKIEELKSERPDADLVHSDGFIFFDTHVHRTLILIEFDIQEATVVWVGTHDQYETTFRNNRNTIRKWLRANDWIE